MPSTHKRNILRKLFIIIVCCGAVFWTRAQSIAGEHIQFSKLGGFYDSSVEVSLSSTYNKVIHYTTDGSLPTKSSPIYQQPISIQKSTVLRTQVFAKDTTFLPISHSYFIKTPESQLPTLSIGINPAWLFDSESGLFTLGSKARLNTTHLKGANFWNRQEYPAHFEFFEDNQQLVFNSVVGLKLFGGVSRLFPQKSLALSMREIYGEKNMKHPVFGKHGPKKIKHLLLRNSGSDFGHSQIRDAFMTSTTQTWEIEQQAYRPAHVYINGRYWGIYNIREKINGDFLESHHPVEKDSLDLLEHRYTVKRGKRGAYKRLLQFLENKDLSNPENYNYIGQQIDINSFIDWQIAQIFFDNQDAGGNIRFWKSYEEDAKWRWILYDMDWGMGLHQSTAYKNNSLHFHSTADGPSWPNPPWSTFIFRKLLENKVFREQFVLRFADHLSQDLSADSLNKRLAVMQAQLHHEIGRHHRRWNIHPQKWRRHLQRMQQFSTQRQHYVWTHLQDYFDLGQLQTLRVEAQAGGEVIVNRHIRLHNEIFSGQYPNTLPIHLSASPHLGFRFLYWIDEQGQRIHSPTTILSLDTSEQSLRAVFEAYDHPLGEQLVINEIGPNNKKSKDWIELYNRSSEAINLSGYHIQDKKDNVFTFPKGTYIGAKDYLILCKDAERFKKVYPQAYNVIDGLSFGVHKRAESLELFDNHKAALDSIAYELPKIDSVFTWSLLLPNMDNGNPKHWRTLISAGSPSAPNPYFVESSVGKVQSSWIKLALGIGLLVLVVTFLFTWRYREVGM